MADTVREIERKYEADDDTRLPDLAGVDRVATVVEAGTENLDAVYYDTSGGRLAADGITLRRRTGGKDAGWHLKLPVAPGVRDEVRAPLSDTPPAELTALVRSRVLDGELIALVRLRTRRTVRVLQDAAGTPLAEVAEDVVSAHRPDGAVGAGKAGAGPPRRTGARSRWSCSGTTVPVCWTRSAGCWPRRGCVLPPRLEAGAGAGRDGVGAWRVRVAHHPTGRARRARLR